MLEVCREAWSAERYAVVNATINRRALLASGAIAGPLLLLVILIDGATRPGYDAWRNGVSQLSSGDRGWLHRLLFIACGLLVLASAAGVRRSLAAGRGTTWGPRLIAAVGAGLIVAGVFPTDPALGYPPGEAETVSLSGGLHQIAGTVLFIGLVGAPIALRTRFAQTRGWATYCAITATLVTTSAVAAGVVYRLIQKDIVPTGPAGPLELFAFLAGFTWITLIALRLIGTPQQVPSSV
jgi:hypothetical protein